MLGNLHSGTTVVNQPSPQMRNRSIWKIAVGLGSQPWAFFANIRELPISDVSSKGGISVYFSPDAARGIPVAGPQPHLNSRGDNLGNVVQFMRRDHPARFRDVLKDIARKIPGVHRIDTRRTLDGRLLLRFGDHGFSDPFLARKMSDGTLKVFAYLLLLHDPRPAPFLCIEEPENGLYHKLLEVLAHEFRDHAEVATDSSQVFLTTHQPYLVDALEPHEVWILERREGGFAAARRASDDPLISSLVAEGLPLGNLWYSDYFDAR